MPVYAVLPRNGIVIDNSCRTSDERIFAIGECALHDGTIYGLAAPGYRMAEVCVQQLSGQTKAQFTGFSLATKLKLAGLEVWTVAEYQADGKVLSWRQGSVYRQLVVRRGRLVGATVIGAWDELLQVQDAAVKNRSISESEQKQFTSSGAIWGSVENDPNFLPESTVICNCMKVERGRLTAAVLAGARSVEDLGKETGGRVNVWVLQAGTCGYRRRTA